MNWIKEHINSIELFLFCWAGTSDIIHWYFHGDRIWMQVGILWLILGLVVHG